VVRCWRGYLSGARCRLAYGPADATATHCKIQIGFTFLVPAHLGSLGQRAVKRVCVCVCGVHEGLVIVCYITGTPLESEQKKEMIRYLRSVQCPDGGWGL